MGGCCCSSRKPHLHGTPVYYYCPPALEGHGPLTSHNSAASAFTAGLLVELHLNTSTPDTFRPPPAPLPYDVVLGCPQSPDSESVQETISHSSFGTLATCEDLDELDCKTQPGSLLVSPRKSEVTKLHETVASTTEEEDACPICLEGRSIIKVMPAMMCSYPKVISQRCLLPHAEYDLENPKHITKCEHHFHLSCILEWMERSDTCPICDQDQLIIYAVPLENFRGEGMKFCKTWKTELAMRTGRCMAAFGSPHRDPQQSL
uniref:RING-type E3 ubiquitin transferase n=1 Tax=Salix viminalis TaxID=40686 RepID=A0A6N2MUK5_SALVM